MRFLLDTNVIIDHLRGGNFWTEFADKLDNSSEIYISSITVFELYCGLSSKDKRFIKKFGSFQKYLKVIDLTSSLCKKAGEIYRDKIKGLEVPDYIIAVSAIETGSIVVTLNKKHFVKIPNVVIYN